MQVTPHTEASAYQHGSVLERAEGAYGCGLGEGVAGEAEPRHGPDGFVGGEIAVVLAGDDLADLLDGIAAAADGHEFTGAGFGRDALHRLQHAALGELEGEAGDDTAHETSQGEGKNGPAGAKPFSGRRGEDARSFALLIDHRQVRNERIRHLLRQLACRYEDHPRQLTGLGTLTSGAGCRMRERVQRPSF